jgi:hypothetical protein
VNFYILITIELPKTQKQKSRKGRVREGLWGRSFNLKGVRFHSTDTQPLSAGRFIIKPAIKDVNKYYSNALDSGEGRNPEFQNNGVPVFTCQSNTFNDLILVNHVFLYDCPW